MLRSIATAISTDLKALATDIDQAKAAHSRGRGDWVYLCDLWQRREEIERRGIGYNWVRFAGRELTGSEKIRHQQAVRKLATAGLVEITGIKARFVKPTLAGWRALDTASPAWPPAWPAPGDAAVRQRGPKPEACDEAKAFLADLLDRVIAHKAELLADVGRG